MILRYPITNLFGRSITLQQNFFGLEFFDQQVIIYIRFYTNLFVKDMDKTEKLLKKHGGSDDGNETLPLEAVKQHVSNMKMVKMVVMQLRAEHDPSWTDRQVKEYEMAMVNRFQK
jgi:hypothetical protein